MAAPASAATINEKSKPYRMLVSLASSVAALFRPSQDLSWCSGDPEVVDALFRSFRVDTAHPLACGICCRDASDGIAAVVPLAGDGRIAATLANIHSVSGELRFARCVIVANPCLVHHTCTDCLAHLVTDRAHPCVDAARNAMPCASLASETCQARYCDAAVFRPLLGDAAFERVAMLYSRHRYVGKEVVPCPLRTGLRMRFSAGCTGEAVVELKSAARGTVCPKCASCDGGFCYHCRRAVEGEICESCAGATLNRYSNRHFRGGAVLSADVTASQIVAQVAEIMAADVPHPRCAECCVPMEKTIMCNAVKHCGREHCYVCGFVSDAGEEIPADHWSEDACYACPRLDTKPFWKAHGARQQCTENVCFTEFRPCTVEKHAESLRAMHLVRRRIMCVRLLRSIPGPPPVSLLPPEHAEILARWLMPAGGKRRKS